MTPRLLLTLLAACSLGTSSAHAFSQSSPITPIGHEWLTVAPALELLKEPIDTKELVQHEGHAVEGVDNEVASKELIAALTSYQEKGAQLTEAEATLLKSVKGTMSGDHYGARHYAIWSAAMGQRWVDIGGFRITAPHGKKCWDAITQAQPHVQASHFLRRFDEAGGPGALHAIKAAQGRLQLGFIAAAMAKDGDIEFWDGGAASVRMKASRPYFLFGRVVHLFQDSFSPEHGARDEKDGFRTITGIKSYVCTRDSAQHTHAAPVMASHGDVVWKARASTDWSDKNVKPVAVATKRAMKDLWVAFVKARSAPEAERQQVAEAEIKTVIAQWMTYNEATIKANGELHQFGKKVSQTFTAKQQEECLKHVEAEATVENTRLACLHTIGTEKGSEFDNDLQVPFNWKNVPKE